MSIAPTASFDWSADDSVVVRPQPALAIYVNRAGAIVIRQEAAWDEDSDVFVIVQPENAHALAHAILREAGADHRELVGNNRQAPTAAAERQRRYRARKRDGDGEGVTRDAPKHNGGPDA